MVKYCPKCGNELNDEDEFCPKCGNKFNKESKKFNFSKKIILIILAIILIAIACFSVYSYYSNHNNQCDIGIATFNTTNATNFDCINSSQGMKVYLDDSEKYTVYVFKYDEMSNSNKLYWKDNVEYEKKKPTQTVDGIVVYTTSANVGKFVGEPRYAAIIEDYNSNTEVYMSTPSVDETVYMAKSFKFK